MSADRRRFINSLVFPALFVILIWLVKAYEVLFSVDLYFLGIYPLKLSGLAGIILSPLIHGGLAHLATNSVPVFILGFMLFYFYRQISFKVFVYNYLITGLWVWVGARESYHIGASGIIYGLASFLFFSGFARRDMRLSAISFVVIFLYGSMVWGIFPEFHPEKNISWESHLAGLVSGLVLAFFFRKEGPQRKKYSWEIEEEMEAAEKELNSDDEQPGRDKSITIQYDYKENSKPEED